VRVGFLNFGMRTNILSLIDSTDLVPCQMLKISRVASHHIHHSVCEKECWGTIRPAAFKGKFCRCRGKRCGERVLGSNALGCPVSHEIDPQETLQIMYFLFDVKGKMVQ
jgi:hypothetical protein